MASCVLDASALMARFKSEPGAKVVEAQASRALISAVNYAEVVGKLLDLGVPDPVADAIDEPATRRAARLRRATRDLGLSLGDRACLALGEAAGLPVSRPTALGPNWTWGWKSC